MNKRQKRINNFKEFFDNSESIFDDISKNDKNHERLKSLFSFYVSPGGRILQYDDKLVEVFYGARPIGIKKTLEDGLQIKEKAETATGATLQYLRTDDGHVACYLYPAKSENQRPIEDLIILDYIKDPSKIKNRIKSHWKLFVSYMESTCIDGDLDFIQKLRVFYLKKFKKYIVSGVIQEQKVKKYISELSKYVLTIGFSGFMILLIMFYMDNIKSQKEKLSRDTISEDITSIKQSAQEITNTLKAIDTGIKQLSDLSTNKNQQVNDFLGGNKEALEVVNKNIKKLNDSIQGLAKAYNNSLQVTPKNGAPER